MFLLGTGVTQPSSLLKSKLGFHLVMIRPDGTAGLQKKRYIVEDFVEESRLQAVLF